MTKLFDEKGRLFGKVSIVDILVVLLCLVLIITVVVRFARIADRNALENASTPHKEYGEYSLTLVIRGIRIGNVNSLRVGDAVCETATGRDIGVITDKTYVVADGYKEGAFGARYNVTLTIRASGEPGDGVFHCASNVELSLKSSTHILTKYVSTSGTVTAVSEL